MAVKKTELYSSLWASCDALRGGMDASQYKDYILTLLFMKYVTDKYKGQKYGDLTVFDKANDPNPDPQKRTGCSFDDFIALKNKKNIGEGIDKIIARLAEVNEGLKGVIDIAHFNDEAKIGKDKEMVDKLTKLIAIFQRPELDFSKNKVEGDDIIGDAYEYLMRNFASESGKSKGQFYTPAEVSRILAKIIGIDKCTDHDATVCDPACGSGSLLIRALAEAPFEISGYGQEKDGSTAGLAKMNAVLHNKASDDVSMIISDEAGYGVARETENIMKETKKKDDDGNQELKVAGWEGKLIPKALIISELFPEEKKAMDDLVDFVVETDSRLMSLVEESAEDSVLSDVAEGGKVKSKDIQEKMDEIMSHVHTPLIDGLVKLQGMLPMKKKEYVDYISNNIILEVAYTEKGTVTKTSVAYALAMLEFLDEEERRKVLSVACSLEISENTRLHRALVQYKKQISEYNAELKNVQNQRYYNKSKNEPEFFKEVSKEGTKRLMAILDALFKAVEKLGGSVNDDLSMRIRNDVVRIRVAETKEKIKHEITRQEAQALLKYEDEIKRHSWASKPQIRQYDYIYNGKLRIVFGEKSYIRDSEKEKLEDRLGDILISLYEKSEENRIVREQIEEEQRKREEEASRQEEIRKRKDNEIRLTKELANKAEDYRIASEIRTYIKAMIENENEEATPEWIEWASRKADWYDPTKDVEDEYLGKREHGKNKEEKDIDKVSVKRGWYW